MSIREKYFKPKWFESEKLYKALGVTVFNRYINPNSTTNRLTPKYREWRAPGQNFGGLTPARTYLESIEAFEKVSERNELEHLGGLAVNAAIEVAAQALDAPKWMRAVHAAGAVTGNVYPILLQRYNRIRTTHVRELLETREIRLQENGLDIIPVHELPNQEGEPLSDHAPITARARL